MEIKSAKGIAFPDFFTIQKNRHNGVFHPFFFRVLTNGFVPHKSPFSGSDNGNVCINKLLYRR